MWLQPRRRILAAMNRTRIVIGFELDRTADCLSGRISGPDGAVVEFAGWLGLVSALDALVYATAPAAPAAPIPSSEGDLQ